MSDKTIPGKRVKTWYRHSDRSVPLRAFVRNLIKIGTQREKEAALAWAGGKVAVHAVQS